jgi:hypothetical protein
MARARQPIVVIPIDGWNKVAEKAIRLGLLLSEEVTAVQVSTEREAQSISKSCGRRGSRNRRAPRRIPENGEDAAEEADVEPW